MVLYTGDIHGDINPIINALYKYKMKQMIPTALNGNLTEKQK